MNILVQLRLMCILENDLSIFANLGLKENQQCRPHRISPSYLETLKFREKREVFESDEFESQLYPFSIRICHLFSREPLVLIITSGFVM